MMRPLDTRPYILNNGEGQFLQLFGASVFVKATSEQTGGAFNVFEAACPPGIATPMHIHYAEDVAIYVLEGTLTFFCGNEQEEALAGSFFFQPRGTPHGFRVKGDTPARILYITFPAGLDRFMLEERRLNHKSGSEGAAARYHIEILGPLPD